MGITFNGDKNRFRPDKLFCKTIPLPDLYHKLNYTSNISITIGLIGAPAAIEQRMALWQKIAGFRFTFLCFNSLSVPNPVSATAYLEDIDQLIGQSDFIDLIDESPRLYEYFLKAAKAHKDVFFANPFVLSLDQLRQCSLLVKESGIKCQPGLYLRFQEDIAANSDHVFKFLESVISLTDNQPVPYSKWLALVNNHVDLLSFLAHAPIKRIAAFSLPINGIEHALLNFRIQFDNRSVGNCTININALVEEQISCLYNEAQQKLILWSKNNSAPNDIFDQNCVISAMEDFIHNSLEKIATKVTIFDALNTVELTKDILNQIEA